MTVSIAAEISGMFSEIDGVSRVTVETSFGRTCDSAGSSSTSSNVSPSLPNFRSSATRRSISSWRNSVSIRVTLAASADGDQATSIRQPARRSRARAPP